MVGTPDETAMHGVNPTELVELLQALAGQKPPLPAQDVQHAITHLEGRAIGYSQLNELLLLMGFDRVSRAFFQYLVDGTTDYSPGSAITSVEDLHDGVDRFRTMAILLFGNVKFGFKTLSRDIEQLQSWLSVLDPIPDAEYTARHEGVYPIENIAPEDTYYLGYVIEGDLKRRLQENPRDPVARAEEDKRTTIVGVGRRNHNAYLTSDHLDVYVATSMRERHEYLQISELGRQIFRHPRILDLKLRWFDPTQAYCKDRIDKGLAEALMLKRAKCTVYLVQETDTLGKDSELASTLAQGKPVIAFVPHVQRGYAAAVIASLRAIYPGRSDAELVLDQLKIFDPRAPWTDPTIRRWLETPQSPPMSDPIEYLENVMRQQYDRRAALLNESHPLGIQVNLATGVANGVLLARTVDQCAELIRRIVTRCLEFEIDKKVIDGQEYLLLRESVSRSIFRVVTGDPMLMNSFWNFYLEPDDERGAQ